MLAYPLTLTPDDNGTVLASVDDVPGVHSFGEDEEEAILRACDALETMLQALIDDREEIPLPSASAGRPIATLSALSEAKVLLYRAMRDSGVRKAELARRLGWHLPQVDRLLDLRHASRLDQIEAAFRALGMRLDMSVRAAA